MATPPDDGRRREDSEPTAHPIRVACKSCRARRVKCDADQGRPCWQCRSRQIPCEPIDSQRGKYDRKRRQRRSDPPEPPPVVARQPPGSQLPPATPPGPHTDPASVYYTVEVVHRPKNSLIEPVRVHYPIPASIVDHSASTARFGPRTIEEPVSLRDALELPGPDIADQLILVFFEIIHAAYPVFDREGFSHAYRRGKASPLVLQTMFLLGFTVCSDALVQQGGFSDRAEARRTHYRRAKALYDADHEQDPVNIAAVLLLLGFWWAGYDEQKDTCHWVGCATTFAQSCGFHRAAPGLDPRSKAIRKRIWWAIYTRDRHTSAAFGRPCRIRDEDCDVECLTQEDFEIDVDYDERLIPPQQEHNVLYVVHMARLAVIWADTLTAEFSPRRPLAEKYETKKLHENLLLWESELPAVLRLAPLDGFLGASFWASMLHFNFRYCQILLFRPKTIELSTPEEVERDKRARAAADAITRNAEDQLATNTIRQGQIHLVPALFGALSIHTIVICRNEPVQRQLAENKSRQCLLALSEISRSWPVKMWITKSFVNLMERMTRQTQACPDAAIINVSAKINQPEHPEHAPLEHVVAGPGDPNLASGDESSRGFSHDQPTPVQSQVFYDDFWTSWLDSAFDVDLIVHSEASHAGHQ